MVMIDIKISQEMKNKSLLNIEIQKKQKFVINI